MARRSQSRFALRGWLTDEGGGGGEIGISPPFFQTSSVRATLMVLLQLN